jgi:uncharacterized protein (DUF1015 family)
MAIIKPFAAWRPRPDLAPRICELPYDVFSSEEARAASAGNPLSFLHVSKPEIDLPPAIALDDPQVCAKGRENFSRLIADDALRRDPAPCFYLYRQIMGDHAQTGLVAVASCDEYRHGVIKKHELTRPDKEEDRVRHIEALDAQTGPVFLTYRAVPALDERFARTTAGEPDVDFVAGDGVRHTAWTLGGSEDLRFVAAEMARVPCLYIADGHHRCAAAARVAATRDGRGHSGFFLAVIFPHDQMQIMAYNRAVADLNGLTAGQVLEQLAEVFVTQPGGAAKPARKHALGFYLEGKWRALVFREQLTAAGDPIAQLDVALLQRHVLEPVFGINDPRTSRRLRFVGGIRGTEELARQVDRGQAACAFSLFPTGIEDLMAVADAGEIMPPKSTWFEPKLRDGMFCHRLEDPHGH